MTRPDPRAIPTLNDLVFPSDRSAVSAQAAEHTEPVADPPSQRRPEEDSETTPQEEKRLEPLFLMGSSSVSTEVFAFEAEPTLPVFGGEGLETSAPDAASSTPQSDKAEPSFGSFVRIHSLAAEEFNIPFLSPSPPAQDEISKPEATESPDLPSDQGAVTAHDASVETISPYSEKPLALDIDNEELVKCIEATVRRAVEAELSQLTQRVTAEVLRVLEITLR